jgi:hypothetical protein
MMIESVGVKCVSHVANAQAFWAQEFGLLVWGEANIYCLCYISEITLLKYECRRGSNENSKEVE